MAPQAFRIWRKMMGFKNQQQAADALGVSLPAVKKWEQGASPIGKPVALACAALARGLKPWDEEHI